MLTSFVICVVPIAPFAILGPVTAPAPSFGVSTALSAIFAVVTALSAIVADTLSNKLPSPSNAVAVTIPVVFMLTSFVILLVVIAPFAILEPVTAPAPSFGVSTALSAIFAVVTELSAIVADTLSNKLPSPSNAVAVTIPVVFMLTSFVILLVVIAPFAIFPLVIVFGIIVTIPASEIVASPPINTAVATFELFPINILLAARVVDSAPTSEADAPLLLTVLHA